jgi:hypothetical protein
VPIRENPAGRRTRRGAGISRGIQPRRFATPARRLW